MGAKMINNLLDIQETASSLRISVSTLYRWVHQKKIEYIKLGSRVFFSQDYLTDFINSHIIKLE